MKWIKGKAAILLTLLAAILASLLWWRARKDPTLTARAATEVEKAKNRIAELLTVRDAVLDRVGARDESIRTIDKQLLDNQRKIVEALENTEGLDNDEIKRRFDRLGL